MAAKSKRAAARDRKRDRVWKETGFRCVYCNQTVKAELRTFDHLWPASRGGGMQMANLIPACQPCNGKRRSVYPAHPLAHPAWRAWVKIREERLALVGTYQSRGPSGAVD